MAGTMAECLARACIARPTVVDEEWAVPAMPEETDSARVGREQAERLLGGGLITGRVVGISRHAVERYQQRFQPGVDFRTAKRRLYSLVHRASYSAQRPDWLVHAAADRELGEHEHSGYLLVDDTVALPLRDNAAPQLPGRFPPQPYTILTVLYRASWG